jgi:recombination associated protein RdgC
MGILSSTTSVTPYRVDGALKAPLMDTLRQALTKHRIMDIDSEPVEHTSGWTSFENPYAPDFESNDIDFGGYWVFRLRIDKKKIPATVLKKHVELECHRRMTATQRTGLPRSERNEIREAIRSKLASQIPATPAAFDIIWQYEAKRLWFLSNLKSANEELETLFGRSFQMTLIRLFPYSLADLEIGLSDSEKDRLSQLTPTVFRIGVE